MSKSLQTLTNVIHINLYFNCYSYLVKFIDPPNFRYSMILRTWVSETAYKIYALNTR